MNLTYLLTPRVISYVQEAAGPKGISVHILNASNERELDAAFAAVAQLPADGLFVGSDPFFFKQRREIAVRALRSGLPATYELREYVTAGGLLSSCSAMERGLMARTDKPQSMLDAFLRAPSRPIFRFSNRPNSSWLLT